MARVREWRVIWISGMLLVDTPYRCEIGRLCRVSDSYFSLPCPLCGYKIQPNELMRLATLLAPRLS